MSLYRNGDRRKRQTLMSRVDSWLIRVYLVLGTITFAMILASIVYRYVFGIPAQ